MGSLPVKCSVQPVWFRTELISFNNYFKFSRSPTCGFYNCTQKHGKCFLYFLCMPSLLSKFLAKILINGEGFRRFNHKPIRPRIKIFSRKYNQKIPSHNWSELKKRFSLNSGLTQRIQQNYMLRMQLLLSSCCVFIFEIHDTHVL